MNSPQPMNMRNGTVVSEKMEPVVPALVCRDLKATKRRFAASNGNVFNTTGAEIRIPISGNFILDNKNINVNFQWQASVVGSLDLSPACLFSQIRVEAGTGSSIVLESIDDPGVWANYLYQYTWSHEDISIQSCKQRSMSAQPGSDGLITKTGATLANANADIDIALDLSLFMGIFNGSSGLPLYDTAGICIVLTLNNVYNAYVTATTPGTMQVSQVYVTASCLEGGQDYERKLKEMKNSGSKEISIMYNTCRRYVQAQASTVANTSGNYLINERSKSCLGFIAIPRDSTNIYTATAYSNSNSAVAAYTNHNYNIAGMAYPISSITTKAEAIDEAYDLYAHLSRRKDSNGLLSRLQAGGGFASAITDATTQLAATAASTGPAQVLAINLAKCGPNENYWGKGMNLSQNALSTYLQVLYTPWQAQTINIYSVFQMKLHIDALGNMTTEF